MNAIENFIFSDNAQYLFKRAYAFTTGLPNQTSALQYGTLGPSPSPIRIRFDIEKSMYGASPNHSKIDLFNLSPDSRNNIKKGYLVQLQAGYNNLIGTIFTGNVFIAKSERKEADIITSLECLDGGSTIVYARLDKSYPAGTNLTQILTDVANAMALQTPYDPAGVSAGIAVGITNTVYPNGFVATGPCKDTLQKLLSPQGLEWTVQDGNLNIIPKRNYDGNTAQVVSAKTGLIGVPSKNDYFTQFTCLLNPKIVPGGLVQLISEENAPINGFYKIRKAKYEGDTHDNKWQITCEATIMNNVAQELPAAQGFNYNPAVIA